MAAASRSGLPTSVSLPPSLSPSANCGLSDAISCIGRGGKEDEDRKELMIGDKG